MDRQHYFSVYGNFCYWLAVKGPLTFAFLKRLGKKKKRGVMNLLLYFFIIAEKFPQVYNAEASALLVRLSIDNEYILLSTCTNSKFTEQ